MLPVGDVEYWASLGRIANVREAIEHGHDVNAQSDRGYTPLHAAAENGHAEVVQLLLDHGAQKGARLDTGETPEDMAIAAGWLAVAEMLREHRRRTG